MSGPKMQLDVELLPGWQETREGYCHVETGLRLTLVGPVGRWGALTAGGNLLVRPRYKTPERVIELLREKGKV